MLDVLERLKTASGATSDLDLSRMLGLSKQAVASAKSTKNIPSSWIPKASQLFNVSTDWLFFGRGPMRPGEAAPIAPDSAPLPEPASPLGMSESACIHCAKLEARLDRMELERRELTTENRELTAEVRHLWKENAELREKCARMEERQYQRSGSIHNEAVGRADAS